MTVQSKTNVRPGLPFTVRYDGLVQTLRDFRYALHTLRTSPAYALTCIAVLALGIGANAAIFSVLNSVILNALPYPQVSQLVYIWQKFPELPPPVGERMQADRPDFEQWRKQATVFSAVEAYRGMKLDETGGDHPRQINAAFATPGLFPLLGAQPRLGRIFTAGEDRVAVLSDSYFERQYGRDPHVLGRTISVGNAAYTIVGVLPPRFHVPSTYEGNDQVTAEVWLPLSRLWSGLQGEREHALNVPARMKPGVTLAQARAEMDRIAMNLQQSDPEHNKGWLAAVFPFGVEDSNPTTHLALYVLIGAAGFLLLIACANLANLTLARTAMRSREIAVRLALGATRGRITALLITEALVVSLAGAALGLLLARWAVKLMVAFKPEDIQRPELISINLPVFAFAALAAIVTTILFGLAPSLGATRADLSSALKNGGWGVSATGLGSRQLLIAIEVALALMLVSGATLMIRSFREILATGLGFDTTRITTADIDLPSKSYPDDASRSRFYRAVIAQAQSIPGIAAAAVTDTLPLHSLSFSNFYISGRPDPLLDALFIADQSHVSLSYFQAIGLRLEAGRWPTERDQHVAVVSREFVRKFFPNEDPIGKILLNPDHKDPQVIIGVAADYRAFGVENGNRPTLFHIDLDLSHATLVVRGTRPAQSLAAAMRDAVWSLDRNLPAVEVRPMAFYMDEWLSQRRFNTLLLEIFAGIALLLGVLGIYGVLANLVASRTREIGIRMAIGAAPGEIAKLILRQSMIPVFIGMGVGVAGSLVLSRFLESLLYQVRPHDPFSLAAAACTLLVAAPVAIYLPLQRATRVDCTVALRDE